MISTNYINTELAQYVKSHHCPDKIIHLWVLIILFTFHSLDQYPKYMLLFISKDQCRVATSMEKSIDTVLHNGSHLDGITCGVQSSCVYMMFKTCLERWKFKEKKYDLGEKDWSFIEITCTSYDFILRQCELPAEQQDVAKQIPTELQKKGKIVSNNWIQFNISLTLWLRAVVLCWLKLLCVSYIKSLGFLLKWND